MDKRKKDKEIEEPTDVIETEEKNPTEEIEKERDEWKSKYLRALADYDNLQKRERERSGQQAQAVASGVLLRLLPFLDNMEKAEAFVKDEGLQMIRQQFADTLQKEGLKELDVLNKPFDPQTAQAISIVEGEEDDMVVEVVQKGYEFFGTIVRPAMVKVSKKITS